LIVFEPGSEYSVRRAIVEVERSEAAAKAVHENDGFAALVGITPEGAARHAWLNPPMTLTRKLFYVLRLTEDVHRFPDTAQNQVSTALDKLNLDAVDLVLVVIGAGLLLLLLLLTMCQCSFA
jgi:hypothetical protein